ncbi:hypothetical protein BZG36_05098 [Bifiguratus adelaidae]|uniref:Uncharacterized protein n=1 Tax=Bifiguratus adelaidae TaxID=1938954 RepID=A0A261XU80_9FUNG|nr:hypothetical protein BZG36_05098 [Bifiguratus adelaidae]
MDEGYAKALAYAEAIAPHVKQGFIPARPPMIVHVSIVNQPKPEPSWRQKYDELVSGEEVVVEGKEAGVEGERSKLLGGHSEAAGDDRLDSISGDHEHPAHEDLPHTAENEKNWKEIVKRTQEAERNPRNKFLDKRGLEADDLERLSTSEFRSAANAKAQVTMGGPHAKLTPHLERRSNDLQDIAHVTNL